MALIPTTFEQLNFSTAGYAEAGGVDYVDDRFTEEGGVNGDGANNQLTKATGFITQSSGWSTACYVKTHNPVTDNSTLYGQYPSVAANRQFALSASSVVPGSIQLTVRQASGVMFSRSVDINYDDGEWHWLGVTFEDLGASFDIRIYLDDAEVSYETKNGGGNGNMNTAVISPVIFLRSAPLVAYLDGIIARVRAWDGTVLTPAQMLAWRNFDENILNPSGPQHGIFPNAIKSMIPKALPGSIFKT